MEADSRLGLGQQSEAVVLCLTQYERENEGAISCGRDEAQRTPEPRTDAPETLLTAPGLCQASGDKVHTSSVYPRGESTPTPKTSNPDFISEYQTGTPKATGGVSKIKSRVLVRVQPGGGALVSL